MPHRFELELLQGALDPVDRFGVEQLAQLGFPEQLAQLCVIDAERLRAALGQRSISVVDEVCDVRKQE